MKTEKISTYTVNLGESHCPEVKIAGHGSGILDTLVVLNDIRKKMKEGDNEGQEILVGAMSDILDKYKEIDNQ